MTALLLAPIPLAVAWIAFRLLRELSPTERGVVLAGAALAAGMGLLAPSLPQNDAWTHYGHLLAALEDPTRLLDPWDRPGFTLYYAATAALGLGAARLASAVLAVVTAAATVRAARAFGFDHAWTAGLFVLAQQDVFGQAASTMTELPFAAAFSLAVLGLAERRPWLAGGALAWCAVTRPEGPLHAALGAAWLLLRERRPGPAALALAGFPLYVAVGALALGDPLWMVNQNPYRGLVGLRLDPAQLWRSFFFDALWLGQPRVLLALEVAGAAVVLWTWLGRREGPARALLPLLAPIGATYLLLSFLRIGPTDAWRESRYLVMVAPALALLGVAGLDAALRAAPRLAPPAVLGLGAWSAVWAIAWHWRPEGSSVPLDALVASAVAGAAAAALGAAPRVVPPRAALALCLAAPLAAAPPGAWSHHRHGQTPTLPDREALPSNAGPSPGAGR